MKRSGKFYRQNESEVMESLGLKPTKNSGSGWIEKEDGQNDNIICQLKSTDAASIKINLSDIEKLEFNAMVSHKIPVFAIQFLGTGKTYLLLSPANIMDAAEHLCSGMPVKSDFSMFFDGFDTDIQADAVTCAKKQIATSGSGRKRFNARQNKKYDKGVKKAK